jgi:hypothetical protein
MLLKSKQVAGRHATTAPHYAAPGLGLANLRGRDRFAIDADQEKKAGHDFAMRVCCRGGMYQRVNRAMSLEAFKRIFWWEYFHRLLGRAIGFVFQRAKKYAVV